MTLRDELVEAFSDKTDMCLAREVNEAADAALAVFKEWLEQYNLSILFSNITKQHELATLADKPIIEKMEE